MTDALEPPIVALTRAHKRIPEIRYVFDRHLDGIGTYQSPSDRDLETLAYGIELARNAPADVTHGEGRRRLAAAVRTILEEAPELLSEAECEAASAPADGRPTDLDRFAALTKNLHTAALALSPITDRRNKKGAWHGWARNMQVEIRLIAGRCGLKWADIGFGKPTARGVRMVAALLDLAGISVTAEAVRDALRNGGPGN